MMPRLCVALSPRATCPREGGERESTPGRYQSGDTNRSTRPAKKWGPNLKVSLPMLLKTSTLRGVGDDVGGKEGVSCQQSARRSRESGVRRPGTRDPGRQKQVRGPESEVRLIGRSNDQVIR
jgi:hypothetical protein